MNLILPEPYIARDYSTSLNPVVTHSQMLISHHPTLVVAHLLTSTGPIPITSGRTPAPCIVGAHPCGRPHPLWSSLGITHFLGVAQLPAASEKNCTRHYVNYATALETQIG